MSLLILTGASCSGKTAIADRVEASRPGFADVFRFDRIGVPSPEAMVSGWGSAEAWQRAMTLRWFADIARLRTLDRPTLFEGQMRIAFIREGLALTAADDARIVLVDCEDAVRRDRLERRRRQSESEIAATTNWAAFLRREAQAGCHRVLDTSALSLDTCVDDVCALLRE